MTLDLFADPEPIAAPAPAPRPTITEAVAAYRAERKSFVLETTGEPNRWHYKGEVITYAAQALSMPGEGRWSTVEGIGLPQIRGFDHVEVCRGIDARQAARSKESACAD